MTKLSVAERIKKFNQGREPKALALKYQAMRADVFGFFRGSGHLFYEDLAQRLAAHSPLQQAPAAWICGDLHLENFGSYRGDNHLAYFDINDFDEAVLAPCTWDIARLLTSIHSAAHILGISESRAGVLCQAFLESYGATLRKGHTRSFERAMATGLIKRLLDALKTRTRKAFLDGYTDEDEGVRQLRVDDKHLFAITKKERAAVVSALKVWAKHQAEPGFYKVRDVARRLAGTASLGLIRYIVLIEGQGSPDQNVLLDLKAEVASSLQPYVSHQPTWENEAARVAAIQARVQANHPACLDSLVIGGQAFLLHELQPISDRIHVAAIAKPKQLDGLVTTLGQIVAWGQLRASGRQGAATADALAAFGQASDWQKPLLTDAQSYAVQVQADYESFRAAE